MPVFDESYLIVSRAIIILFALNQLIFGFFFFSTQKYNFKNIVPQFNPTKIIKDIKRAQNTMAHCPQTLLLQPYNFMPHMAPCQNLSSC